MLNKFSKKIAHVIDVGSSKITVMTGVFYGEKCAQIKQAQSTYAGFLEGEFLEPSEIANVVSKTIESVELETKIPIKNLAVGVPSEFCYSVTKKVNATFATRQKLTPDILDEIYKKATEDLDCFTPINIQPIYAILDDGKKVISPVNFKTSKITVLMNIIYAQTKFIQFFNDLLSCLGVEKVSYISSPLCVSQINLGDLASEACVVDIGYLSSSVCVAKGKGLTNLFSFSLGGAQIEAKLMDEFALTFQEAEGLKKNVVLTLQANSSDCYETSYLGKTRKILVNNANAIVLNQLETLAFVINSCLEKSDLPATAPIYLTGGGITQIQGAKAFLESYLNRIVTILSPNLLGFNKPYQTSCISLLITQIINQEKPSFFVAN